MITDVLIWFVGPEVLFRLHQFGIFIIAVFEFGRRIGNSNEIQSHIF